MKLYEFEGKGLFARAGIRIPRGRVVASADEARGLADEHGVHWEEPWGGGKWHLEIFRSVNPEPEDWNGEM